MAQNQFLQSPFDALAPQTDTSIYTLPSLPGSEPVKPQEVPDVTRAAPAQAAQPVAEPEPVKAPPRRQAATSNLLPPAQYAPIFEAAAREFDVPVNVLMALGHQESRYNTAAIGQTTQWGRAKGMMQYLDSTASGLGINPFSAEESIPAAARQIRERLDKGYSMEDAVKEHFAGPNRKLWGEKTAAYGREVMEKVGKIGELLGSGATAPAATDPLADLNKNEPGRYRVATPEEVAAFEKRQSAGLTVTPTNNAEQQKAADERGFFDRAGAAASSGYDNMVQSLNTAKFVIGGGDSMELARALSDKFAEQQKAQRTTGQKEMDAAFKEVSDAEGVVDTTVKGAKAIYTAITNPKDLAIDAIEQLPNMLPTMGAGVAGAGGGAVAGAGVGAVAGGVGAAPGAIAGAIWGGRAGMLAGTAATELGAEVEYMIGQQLAESRRAPTPENIKSILDSPGFIAAARDQGLKKGLTVAVIDQLFLGLGGKVAGKAGKAATVGGKAAYGAGAVALDATGEVVGEAASQKVARGEVDAGDALKEGVIGLGQSVVEPVVGAGMQSAKRAGQAMRPTAPAPASRVEPTVPPVAAAPVAPGSQAPSEPVATAAPSPSGPLTGAVEKAAGATEQPPRVSVVAPEGEVTGFMQSMQEDGQGGFTARVLGDDGQVYTFTSADGVTITPLAPEPAGPLTAAVEKVAEQAPSTPAQAPSVSVAAPNIPAEGVALAPAAQDPQEEKGAEIKAAFDSLSGGGTTDDLYNKAFDALKAGKSTISGVKDPILSRAKAAFDAGLIGSPQDIRAFEQNGYPEVQPAPQAAPSLTDMTEPELRERLKYIASQGKANGWNKMLTNARREVEREINRRAEGATTDARPNAVAAGVRDEAAGGVQADAPAGMDQPAGRDGAAQLRDVGSADTGAPVPQDGASVPAASDAADGQPALTKKQSAALDRIAKGTAYFGSQEKADAFIAKNGIGDTHEVVQTGKVRFDVKAKAPATAEESSTVQAEAMPDVKEGYVRLYRGQPNGEFPPSVDWVQGSGPSEKGRWFSTNIEDAKFYGKNGVIRYVDVPTEVADASTAEGMLSSSGRLLPAEWANKAKDFNVESAQAEATPAIIPAGGTTTADEREPARAESQAVRDFLDGKRPDAPTLEEVAAEQAPAKSAKPQEKIKEGDTITLARDIDYATAGTPYTVERVGKRGIEILNKETGGRTSLPWYSLRNEGDYSVASSTAAENKPAAEQAPAQAEPLLSAQGDNKRTAAPGTRVNGDAERAAADRLDQLYGEMSSITERNSREGNAKAAVRSMIEELRKPRTVVSVEAILEKASSDLNRKFGAFSTVIDEVLESISTEVQPAAEQAPAIAQPSVVAVPQSVSDAMDGQMRKQKGRITRLKNEMEKAGSLEEKRAAETKVKAAEATLRKMRTSRFDAEDAAIKAIESKSADAFSDHADIYSDAFAEIQSLIASSATTDAQTAAPSAETKSPSPNVEFIKALAKAREELPEGFDIRAERDSISLMENGRYAVNGLSRNAAGAEEAVRLAKQRAGQKPEVPTVSENKVFTEDAAAKARALLRSKLGQLNTGIDPEVMQAGITLAGYHIEKGARTFAAYAKAMIEDLGDVVKPYLKSWYMGVKYDPRAAGFDGMSDAAEVEGADVDALLKSAPSAPQPSGNLMDSFYQAISAGSMPSDNNALRKMVSDFDGAPADNARLKIAQEALEAAIARRARDIVAEGGDVRQTYDKLVDLYQSQPNLNIRTSTSIENQAYSTPAPLAYVSAKLAGIDANTTVYEPTAGNGMLLITADPKNATANELEDTRFENLKAQGFDAIQGDALDVVSSGAVAAGSQDAVITNPPFGSVKDENGKATKVSVDGYKIGKIDHLIAAEALKAMKDGGKATLIIGADKAAGGVSTDDRIFFNWLYGNYNVTSHFEVDGKLYSRQGASWPVRVITVDGRRKSSNVSPRPGEVQRVGTWEEVYEQYQQGLDSQVADDRGAAVGADGAVQRDRADDAGTASQPAGAEARRDGAAKPRARKDGAGDVAGERAGAVRTGDAGAAERVAGAAGAQRGDGAPAVADRLADGAAENRPAGGKARADRPARDAGADRVENEFQSAYVPRSSRKDEGVLIPVNMAQPTQDALNALEDEVGDIDEYVMRELGYPSKKALHDALMGLQVDSVASAIYQIGKGKGVVIADQTGIGKGRQAAAVIRWAKRKGFVPVFVTVKPQLFTDMFNDLSDIGTDDVAPLLMNADEWIANAAGEKLFTNKKSAHRKVIGDIAATGQLPEGRNALFLTYSQINTENAQREAIGAIAEKSVIVLDECVPAGTMIATPSGAKAIETLKVGDVVIGVDHLTGNAVATPVLHTFRRDTEQALVRIGSTEMTPEHPVFTKGRGYVASKNICASDVVCSIMPHAQTYMPAVPEELRDPEEGLKVLFNQLRGSVSQRKHDSCAETGALGEKQEEHDPLAQRPAKNGRADGISEVREEPNQEPSYASKVGACLEGVRVQELEWRERGGSYSSADASVCEVGLGNGNTGRHWPAQAGDADALHDRHRGFVVEDSGRGGWGQSSIVQSKGERSEKRRVSTLAWMDGAALLKQRGDGGLGSCGEQSSSSREVFNIETGTANYFANGLLVHNCHNAAGDSSTGTFIRDVLGKSAGVLYLSATYAKRPDNMPVYFKTDIGMAISDDGQLMGAMAAGGLPLQTVVSNNLVKAGQMFRRERSYDGVSISTIVATERRAEHEKLSDAVTEALRGIVDADRAFHNGFVEQMAQQLAMEGAALKDIAGNQASQSVNHTEFSSVVHNFVRQLLLGLKADAAADRAIEAIKAGEKPLIAVENTMGSFLAEYAAAGNIRPGQPLGNFDYRTVLSRALERSRVIVIKDPTGNDTKRRIELSELDPVTRDAYDRAQAVIDGLELDIPVSPIDWMRNRIQQAGYTVAEITGRNLTVDYSEGAPKLSQLPTDEQNDKVGTTRKFNDGRLDAIILNVSGSTGISLHASEKFKDQRPRRMVVAQAAQDINIFMQMLGRIHRTGQVVLPSYEILSVDLPAEKRPTAILSNKMKSLNANTSSNTESATSIKSSDLLNKYGDQVVGAYLADNMELSLALGIDEPTDGEGKAAEDLARKATGRLALMPVEVQKAFYAEVEEQYNNLIDYLNKTNQNELEPRTFDFDARETASQVIFEGDNPSSPFGSDAIYHEYSIKAQGKPMTPDEIRAEIAESLGGQDAKQHASDIVAGLDAQFGAFTARLTTDAQMEAANAARRRAGEFIRDHRIGSGWRVEINGDVYNAVVTNIRSTHKGAGNPFSMSKIQVTVALNGALRNVTVPATQFEGIEVAGLGAAPSINSLFESAPKDERQTAKIITGNLLAAYGEISTKGTIINFTKADGSTEQGILLPKAFNPAINTRGDYRIRTVADALKFLRESEDANIARFGIANREGTVRVVPEGSGVALVVPKSKAKGGKFFLNKKITDITGDFVSQGQTMRVTVPASKAADAVAVIMDMNALYALPSMAVEAKKIVGDGSGETRYSVAGSAGFFSALAQFVENAEAKSATADGWMQQIRGQVSKGNVKADEVAWTGVEEWLSTQTGKVPREAVAEFLRANGVQVQETTLGVTKTPLAALRVSDVPEGERSQFTGSDYFEPTDWLVFRNGDWVGTYQGGAASEAQAVERYRAEAQDEGYDGVLTGGETKYGNYTLPGGENYREVLLTLPDKVGRKQRDAEEIIEGLRFQISQYEDEINASDADEDTDWISDELASARAELRSALDSYGKIQKENRAQYRSSHWDQPNILAHIRLNDRTDADGKRVLFVEELQSDWAQEGKKKGFKAGNSEAAAIKAEYDAAAQAVSDAHNDGGNVQAARERLARATDAYNARINDATIPTAPFIDKTDKWVALALKRVIKMAVDEGYDRVAFVTGEQSAARYDLSKHIDRIHYEKSEDGLYELIAYKIGSRDDSTGSEALHEDEIDLARIEELVGKDIAQKIADEAGEKIGGSYRDWRELKNVDLKVGGEGMKAFYDRIVPSVLKDVLKKVGGGTVGVVELQIPGAQPGSRDVATGAVVGPNGTAGQNLDAPGFDITPAMKKKAANGLPLFSAGVGGALTKPALRDRLTTGVIGPVVSRLIDAGVIVLHKDVSTLPKSIKAVRGMQAATDGKTVHMVASGLTAENARGVLLHESFHEGGEKLIGTQQWNALMKRLDALRRQSEQSTGRAREFFDKARARVESAERRGAVTEGFAPEEFGAYAIEEYENAPAAVRKWVDDFIGAIKAWVLKRFGKQLGQITPAQLSAIAKMALMDAAAARVEQVGALRFSAAPATGTPAFRAWFGDSAIKNADGSPKVMYHGTGADMSRFTPNNLGLIFVTPDTAFADVFAVRRPGDPGNANVLPVYVKAEKPFDASKPAHVKAVMQQIGDTRDATGDPITADRLAVAEWWALEDPAIVNAIKAAGFDGMYAMEAGIKNLAVFEPTQVKSAIGNAGTFDAANPDIRYSVSSEEADRLIDVADKALDAAPDRLPKDDYIGRVVGDLSLGAKLIVHPRTVAAVHQEFTPVYLTAISQIETRDATIAELGAGATEYNRLGQGGKENVNKVLELGRLMSQTYKADELTAGITNTGEKTVVSVGEDGKPRMAKVPVEALLSGAGEVIKLTPEEAKAYSDLRDMFDRALDKMRDQTLDELGFPELAGKKNAAADIAKMAKEEQGEKAERLKNIAVFVAEIEQAKRAGYVPFARYGDYVVTVKEKVADLTYVEDDAQHLIVQDVPASFAGDMLDLGAEETAEGWRIKKSQKASVERLTEKTVYSTKVETRIRDFFDERKAGKVDDIQPVREAIEKARAEYVGDNPNRRVVAFKAREKTPDAPVRLSDVDALAEVAQIDNATWDAVRDKLADAIKAKGFRRHFFHSDNVPGYTGDFERAIADYVIGMSGYLARRAHMKRWEHSVTAIKDKPKLFQYASKYRDYVNSPQEEFAMVRQIGFFSYIAGVVASAFANLTQVPMLTVPTLAQVAPLPAVMKEVARAYKDAMKMLGRPGKVGLDMFDPDKAPADVRDALKEAWSEGAFVPLETYDLMMTARQRNTGARKGVKLFNDATRVVSIAFTFAERLNRLVTFIAAARLAAKPAVQANAKSRLKGDALARREVLSNWGQKPFAEWVVDESQYRMGKANRPTAMRGVGAALMQFKGYMLQTFEAWYRMSKLHGKQGKFAMAASLVTLYAFAGLWGLPGADDLRKLIEDIYKKITKKDLDLKTELRMWIAKTSGSNTLAQIVSKGASYPLGVDLTRVGMGSVVPDSPLAVGGIPFDMLIGRPSRAFDKASSGDAYSAVAEFTPNFMKHWIVAGGWAVDGVRDKYGSRILRPEDLSDADIGMKALGFQPSIVTDIRDYEYAQRRQETAVDALKRRYTSQLAKALAALETEDDPAEYAKLEQKVDEVYAEIDEHNESAPEEQQIVIGKRALDNRIQREAEGIKSTWGKERKNARGAAEDLRSVFGLSEEDEE